MVYALFYDWPMREETDYWSVVVQPVLVNGTCHERIEEGENQGR